MGRSLALCCLVVATLGLVACTGGNNECGTIGLPSCSELLVQAELPVCANPGPPGFDLQPNLPFISALTDGDSVGGVVIADLDGDDRLDVFTGQQSGELTVYWNEGSSFTEEIMHLGGYGAFYGASAADANADGVLDLVVVGPETASLLLSDGHRGLSELTLDVHTDIASAATWGDIDRDGDLDLFIVQIVPINEGDGDDHHGEGHDDHDDRAARNNNNSPLPDDPNDIQDLEDGAPNLLMRNDGGNFNQVDTPLSDAPGVSHHARFEDFDQDGQLELLVLNELGTVHANSELWSLNETGWVDIGGESFGVLDYPMGAIVQDIDGDGITDFMISEISGLNAFVGSETGLFTDVSEVWFDPSMHVENDVSWSLVPVDIEGDGIDEFYVSYGGLQVPFTECYEEQPNRLYRWNGAGIEKVEGALPALAPGNSRGVARGDLNGDGWPDLVIRHLEGPLTWLQARCTGAERLVIELQDTGSANRFAIGARVTVNGVARTVEAGGLGSYSGSPPELYFGLGDSHSAEVQVRWPDGVEENFSAVATGTRLVIRR